MNNKVIQIEGIEHARHFLGNKTLGLKKCHDLGYTVPKFVALPSFISTDLLKDDIFRAAIVQEVLSVIKCDEYVVRSSALIEDGKTYSFAGQFLTKLHLSEGELDDAIKEVLTHAEQILKAGVNDFSIIIQEYIVADMSGVAFTRNPNGGREMIIEYGYCDCEKIVSGKIKPIQKMFYWHSQQGIGLPDEFEKNCVIEKFKELEGSNGAPQDIEWCIKDGLLYILQTRAITTISPDAYEQIIYLERLLPSDKKYFFAKTDICEISTRPCPVTYNLLHLIYSNNGPVYQVYKKYGIDYVQTDFLTIIGNELFVDKEKEIQGLLPSYTYLRGEDLLPKFRHLSKLFPTIKNLFSLNTIGTRKHEALFKRLKEAVEKTERASSDLKSALDKFLVDYELVFETNLLSGFSIKKLNLLLKNEPVHFIELLSSHSSFIDLNKYKVNVPTGIAGNSLELSDLSPFNAKENMEDKTDQAVAAWWKQVLYPFKKKLFQDSIVEALSYDRFRELGRWITVKHITTIRNLLLERAEKCGFTDQENIFFADLDDLLDDNLDEYTCIQRRNSYNKYNRFNFPVNIASSIMKIKSEQTGISAGIATGKLQDQKTIDSGNEQKEKVILYTEMLTPDLTKYFDKISGIVSCNGGVLSHLAIMARENNIPVISGFSIKGNAIKFGDYVQIDGVQGEITKCERTD
jgi:phosphohistidine swiveling domain-containing protein